VTPDDLLERDVSVSPPPSRRAATLHTLRQARRGPRRRHAVVVGALLVTLVAVFALRVLGGDYTITLPDFFRILGGKQIPGATFILTESKLPRAVLGVLVGVAFGVAGAIFQSVLRNPLASPDVIGVSAGASAAAVYALVVLHVSGVPLTTAAIVGALVTALGVRFAAGRPGASTPAGGVRVILVGVTVTAGLLAVVQYLFTRADVYDAQLALRWLTGSLNGVTWSQIQGLALCLLVLLPALALLHRSHRSLELGPDTARALGSGRYAADRLLLVAVLLTAVAVGVTGPISFVAFFCGPIARALNGGRTTLVGAGLVGAVTVVGADYLAAYAIPGVNLPVGVVTGAFGAPFLLWLLTTSRSSA
jgi:iron complex transport system permease protein